MPVDTSPAALLNRYCQTKKLKPEFEVSQVPGSKNWRCVVRVLGVGFTAQAIGGNQKDAKHNATLDFVKNLQKSGSMDAMPAPAAGGNKKKKGGVGNSGPKAPGPVSSGPSWKIPDASGTKMNLQPARSSSWKIDGGVLPPSKKQKTEVASATASSDIGSVLSGIQVGMVAEAAGSTFTPAYVEAQYQKMLGYVQEGKPSNALKVAKQNLQGATASISMHQVGKLVSAIAIRAPFKEAMELLDGLYSMDLVAFPDVAGATYFCRFARWAMKEFSAEGLAALEGNARSRLPMMTVTKPDLGGQVTLVAKTPLPNGQRYSKGDWLFVTCPHTAKIGPASFEAELVEVVGWPPTGITVKLVGCHPNTNDQIAGKTCRVDKAGNRVTFSRQMEALSFICDEQNELRWLRKLLLASEQDGSEGIESQWAKQAIHCSKTDVENSHTLNPSQKTAVKTALSQRVTLIQGPPGTGKTHMSCMLVKAWVSAGRRPILATAESNVAVDNLVSGLVKLGVEVVRVGRPEPTRPDLDKYNLQEKARAFGCNTGKNRNFKGEKELLSQTQVVCCTCSGTGQPVMEGLQFTSVLIDEAAQATELAVVMPLTRLHTSGSAVLVGDHKQLPPTIISQEANDEGLGTPLFGRLVSRGVVPMMLDIQYRMHPAICKFPSETFYDARLRSGTPGRMRLAPQGFDWPDPLTPIAFVHVDGREHNDGNSWQNANEVSEVENIIQRVLAANELRAGEIGVITPYSAQVKQLKQCVSMLMTLCAHDPLSKGNIEVGSVDGFQGREKDLIILSTVRANAHGNLGFLTDPRRLNVAITRPRRGLVVVGHSHTLNRDAQTFGPWLRWAQERGLVLDCPATSPEAKQELCRLDGLGQEELLAEPVPEAPAAADSSGNLGQEFLAEPVPEVPAASDSSGAGGYM